MSSTQTVSREHRLAALSDSIAKLRGAEAILWKHRNAARDDQLDACPWISNLVSSAVNRLHGADLVTADYLSDLIWQVGWARNFGGGELAERLSEFARILDREIDGWAELSETGDCSAPLPLGRYDWMGMRKGGES